MKHDESRTKGVLSLLTTPAVKVAAVGTMFGFYGASYVVPHHHHDDGDPGRFGPLRHEELAETATTHPVLMSLVGNAARLSIAATTAVASHDTLDIRLTEASNRRE